MRYFLFCCLLAISTQALSADYMDDTHSNIPDEPFQVFEEIITRKLNHPYSAKVYDLRYVERTDVICGRMNSKNRYGAYVGLTPFFAKIGEQTIDFLPDQADAGYELVKLTFSFVGCSYVTP